MLNRFKKDKLILLSLTILFSFFHVQALAKITLQNGSYSNRTHIDMALGTANLNFVYEGCDQTPDPSKIKLSTDGSCKDAKSYFLENSSGKKTISGTVGEITAKYNDNSTETCANQVKVNISSNYTLDKIYKDFKKKGCKPTHMVIRDSDQKSHNRTPPKSTGNKNLCTLQNTKVKKPGFVTDSMDILNFTAKGSMDGFKIGHETDYTYTPEKGWCIDHVSRPKDKEMPCGDWATPVPLAHYDTATKKFQVKGIISLRSDGSAVIGTVNKSYDSYNAIFADIKTGNVKADKSKGALTYHTWKKRNGVKRALVSSYDGKGKHQRSINFMARNIFGKESSQKWCAGENCFVDVEKPPLSQHKCKKELSLDMDKGGSGNVCYSCVGMLPGACATKPADVAKLKETIGENDSFNITKYGEYELESNATIGVRKKFAEMLSKPSNHSCVVGNAPDIRASFAPEQDESGEDRPLIQRVVNSVKSMLGKKVIHDTL